jgi:hypothetical protein
MPHRQDIMISAKQPKRGRNGYSRLRVLVPWPLVTLWDKIYIYKERGEFSNHVQKCEKLGVKNIVVQHIARLCIADSLS